MSVAPSKFNLLRAGVLGSLRDGVLGQLSGQEETDRGLDLARGDGGPLVDSLGGGSLGEVVDKGVYDGHGLGGHSGVGVHLLQHHVDVEGIIR